jgi:UDP-glucose 6-dehydrogenase
VTPGTTDAFIEKYRRSFVFMPEFLREWNAEYDANFPDKIVIGTDEIGLYMTLGELIGDKCSWNKYINVKPIEAEIAKLALNSLALIKVVFAEELYSFSKTLGADYNNIFNIFHLDSNINSRHLLANNDGYRGAGGKCLPKDSQFLFKASKEINCRISTLETAIMAIVGLALPLGIMAIIITRGKRIA